MEQVSGKDVCVVVPAYNEAAVIGDVITELCRWFSSVICVDDGSSDSTASTARISGAIVVRHAINLGQGAALQTGFDYAIKNCDPAFVVTFDADGQHRVQDARAMVAMARAEGLHFVLGSRNMGSTTNQPLRRRLLLGAALRLSRRMTTLALTDTHNGLRVLSGQALQQIRLTHTGMAYASELEVQVARTGLAWSECPTDIQYTEYSKRKGQTNLNAINILYDLAVGRLRGAI